MEEASIHSLSNTGSIGAFTNLIDLFVDATTNFKLRAEMLSRKYEGVWNNRWAAIRNDAVNPLLIPQEHCSAFFNCALSYLNDRGHNPTVISYLEILPTQHGAHRAVDLGFVHGGVGQLRPVDSAELDVARGDPCARRVCEAENPKNRGLRRVQGGYD